jgi:hypothetical protein
MMLDRLLHPDGPNLHLVAAPEARLCDATWALEETPSGGTAVRVVRGAKARTHDALFDEVAAALQFPYDFAENWAALDECLAHLAWLRADAFVLVISHALRLLDRARPEEFALFIDVIDRVAREWASPVAPDGRTPRAPRAFHVVFHAPPDDEAALSQRLLAAGAVFDASTLS